MGRLDPADVCRVIDRHGVTYLQLVGDAFGRPIVEEMERGAHDLSSVTTVLSGGAALSPGVKTRLLDRLPGITLVESIGSSEGGGQGVQVSTAGQARSTGTFVPTGGSVVVSEDRTRLLSPGDEESGWLAKQGPDIPLGYLGDAEKTARTFPVVAGERMSVPGDPDVDDVVVSSRPSERWGQEVVAIVRLRTGTKASASGLAAVAAHHVARYKLPKAWVFVDAIERSPAGKADYRWAATVAAKAAP